MIAGRGALLDPVHQRGEELVLLAGRRLVGIARQISAAARRRSCRWPRRPGLANCARRPAARHPHELLHLGVAAHRRRHPLMIVDAAGRRDRVVGKAVVDDHLAAESRSLARSALSVPRLLNTAPAAPTAAQSIWLVAEREIGSKLRSKAFVISTAILFLGALALVVCGGFSAGNSSGTAVAVTSDAVQYVPEGASLDVTDAADRAAAEKLVTAGDVDAAIVGDTSSPLGFTVIAESEPPTQLMLLLAQVPPVELLDPDEGNPVLRYFVAIGFGIVFLLAASLFGGTIAQSVVEEKQTRVVEILISAIRDPGAAGRQGDRQHHPRDGADPGAGRGRRDRTHDHRTERDPAGPRARRSSGSRSSSCSGSSCSPRCSPRPPRWSRVRRTSARPPSR